MAVAVANLLPYTLYHTIGKQLASAYLGSTSTSGLRVSDSVAALNSCEWGFVLQAELDQSNVLDSGPKLYSL